jgi:hypothetical protein
MTNMQMPTTSTTTENTNNHHHNNHNYRQHQNIGIGPTAPANRKTTTNRIAHFGCEL